MYEIQFQTPVMLTFRFTQMVFIAFLAAVWIPVIDGLSSIVHAGARAAWRGFLLSSFGLRAANILLRVFGKKVVFEAIQPRQRALVISAFPGCGKTSATKDLTQLGYKALDSDSRQFSWLWCEGGPEGRDPNFPKNYIDHIKENMATADVIFVSSHQEVRDAMVAAGIKFITVYPNPSLKESFLEKYYRRGSDTEFSTLMDAKWDEWIKALRDEAAAHPERVYWCQQSANTLLYTAVALTLGGLRAMGVQ